MMLVDYATYYDAQNGKQLDISWLDATKMFAAPKAYAGISPCVTADEKSDEYKVWKQEIDKLKKDNGYVFWGETKDGKKGKNDIINHSAIALDYDGIENGDEFLKHIESTLADFNYMYYSTTKSTNDVLRLRVIIPLNRPSANDEYQALARQMIKLLGTDGIDKTSIEDNRAMGYTVLLKNQKYVYKAVVDKAMLDVDVFLQKHNPDWQNSKTWFYMPMESAEIKTIQNRTKASKSPDEFVAPGDLRGWVGAFCRALPISKAFSKYLPDIYEPAGENRYTYKAGSSVGGVVVFDDRCAVTFHATDPARGCHNAWDFVKAHLYGNMSEQQSKQKMIALAKNDVDVVANKNKLKPVDVEIPEFARNWLDFFEYPANDYGIAKRLLDLYKNTIGWATDAKCWMLFNDTKWDDVDTAVLYGYFDRVALIMRALSKTGCNAEDVQIISKIVDCCQTSRYRDGILKALKPMIMIKKGDMDSDVHGINTTAGYLRLNNTEDYLIPCNPDLHCRKIAGGGFGTDFKPDEECLNYLKSMFPSEELYHWVHKFFGYCLTGSTVEKKLVFLYGPKGNNGKSSLITLAKNAFGDYQTIGDENMLLSTKYGSDGDSPTPSIAKLQGVRLCLIDEMPDGRKLNGSAIKRMTHGAGLKGRDLHQSTINFTFQGKIVVACNTVPTMADAWDSALRLRIRIVPFLKYFDAKTADESIENKIYTKSWKDTFLYWCFEGLQYYLTEKLDDFTGDSLESSNMPDEMKNAMREYFSDSDEVGDFIETYCEITGNPDDCVSVAVLYDMYVKEQKTSYMLSKKLFSTYLKRWMQAHGCGYCRRYMQNPSLVGGGRGSQQRAYYGIRFID